MEIHQAFRLLKLDAGASLEVVQRRYHELAARWHPDRLPPDSPDSQQAAEKMKELNAAYAFIRRFYQAHLILFCTRCGAANCRPKDVNLEYAACANCGKQLQRATPRKKKIACGNERCAGTIGSNGCCNYCGKTAAEGRKGSLAAGAGESGGRIGRSRSFARSAARIAKTLFLVGVAGGAVTAAYLYHHRHGPGSAPAPSNPETFHAAPPAVASPQRVETRRAFFQAPSPVVVPEDSFYRDLFKKRTVPREEILRLQRILKAIGYAVETVDGAAGRNTAASLRRYSADFGYLPTVRFPHCFFEHAALHYRLALAHPDWLDIFLSGDVNTWVEAQPEGVRREIEAAACERPSAAVQLIRRYKFDRYKPLPRLLPETKILGSTSPEAAASLRIRTPAGKQHYLVKLVDTAERREAAFAFIRSGSSLAFRLPFGSYELTFASGDTWFGPEFQFGPSAQYGRLRRLIRLTEKERTAGGDAIELPLGAADRQVAERISAFDF